MGAAELGESGDYGFVPSASRLDGLDQRVKPVVESGEQISHCILLFAVGVIPPLFEIDEAHPERGGDGQSGGVTTCADKTGIVPSEVERVCNGWECHRRYLTPQFRKSTIDIRHGPSDHLLVGALRRIACGHHG